MAAPQLQHIEQLDNLGEHLQQLSNKHGNIVGEAKDVYLDPKVGINHRQKALEDEDEYRPRSWATLLYTT